MQKFVVIKWPEIESQPSVIAIKFELWQKNLWWNGPLELTLKQYIDIVTPDDVQCII